MIYHKLLEYLNHNLKNTVIAKAYATQTFDELYLSHVSDIPLVWFDKDEGKIMGHIRAGGVSEPLDLKAPNALSNLVKIISRRISYLDSLNS